MRGWIQSSSQLKVMSSLGITASLLSYAMEMYYFLSCLPLMLQITHLSPPLLTLVTFPEQGLQLPAAALLRARTSTVQDLCPGLLALPEEFLMEKLGPSSIVLKLRLAGPLVQKKT